MYTIMIYITAEQLEKEVQQLKYRIMKMEEIQQDMLWRIQYLEQCMGNVSQFSASTPTVSTNGSAPALESQNNDTNSLPQYNAEPLPLTHKLRNTELQVRFPSNLKPIEEVIAEHKDLLAINAPETLAQYIAKEAVFGDEIMKQCTPSGRKQRKALPQKELMMIKRSIFQHYRMYWNDVQAFEDLVWSKCHISIERACGRIRRQK